MWVATASEDVGCKCIGDMAVRSTVVGRREWRIDVATVGRYGVVAIITDPHFPLLP